MSDTATPAPAAKKNTGTDYAVLRQGTDGGSWHKEADVRAANADTAIKQASKNGTGTFVAIPSSSFKPRKVTVEQTVRVKLEDA